EHHVRSAGDRRARCHRAPTLTSGADAMDWRQLWSAQRLARLRRRHSVQLAAGALILLALAFAAGRWSAAPGQRQLELAQQAELIAQLQKELATAQVNSDVEQRTITALQATLAQQQRQLAA